MAEHNIFLLDGEEFVITSDWHTRCSGGPAGGLGHPVEYLTLEKTGEAICGYCDRHFVHETSPKASEIKEKGKVFSN